MTPEQQQILIRIKTLVEQNSHSAASLTLFALMKTLSSHNHQYLFLLNKLRDLDSQERDLAYALMEIMVAGKNDIPAWNQAVAEIEALIRSAC